jgi:hypothetical protein
MAASSARTAARPHAADWCADEHGRGRSNFTHIYRGACPGITASGLDSWPQKYRWTAGNAGLYRKYAAELVALTPEVILASNTTGVRAQVWGRRELARHGR